ncbi:MAG: acetyl-CoA hydrolase [Ruminococcaceae bacterium]|nr:acetyl-CoA hydrolase [Oscillospiraceae bacterium]
MKDDIKREYQARLTTAEAAAGQVKSGDNVYLGTCSSVAEALCEALMDREGELENVTVTSSNVLAPLRILRGETGTFRLNTYFMGAQERNMLRRGLCDFTTVHLREIEIFCRQTSVPDVAFLEVSPPDEDGYMSFGASGVILHRFMADAAKTVILQVNRNAPYVYGEMNRIHVTEADAIVEADRPIGEGRFQDPDDTVRRLSGLLLEQIPDGACIQLGIGNVATAVGFGLEQKNDLGIHSELMSDSIMYLMKKGVANNSRKTFMPGKSVVGFTYGSRELYEFLDHNEDMYFMPFPRVNDIDLIAKNDNMISINTAMSADLFGQISADNITGRQFSGVGGQIDFVRGAQAARGGKSFIAMTSTFLNRKGERQSRIVPYFPPFTAVTTSRADVQYLATEYGCVNLKPLLMSDRVRAVISLAHPDYREELTDAARAAGLL